MEHVSSHQVAHTWPSSEGFVILSRGQNAEPDPIRSHSVDFSVYGQNYKVKMGETIFREGNPVEGLFFLKNGLIKLSRKSLSLRGRIGGEYFLCDILGPGNYIGLTDYFEKSIHNFQAVALQPSDIIFFAKSTLQNLLDKNIALMRELLSQSLQQNLSYQQRFYQHFLASVGERIASLLLDLSERFGEATPQGVVLNLKLSRSELAQLAGTINESLSRHLGDLKEEGIIDVQGKKITIRDRRRLEAKAGYHFLAHH